MGGGNPSSGTCRPCGGGGGGDGGGGSRGGGGGGGGGSTGAWVDGAAAVEGPSRSGESFAATSAATSSCPRARVITSREDLALLLPAARRSAVSVSVRAAATLLEAAASVLAAWALARASAVVSSK